MILAVELVGLLVVEGVRADIHPGPGVEHLHPVAVGVGHQGDVDGVVVSEGGVIPGVAVSLERGHEDPLPHLVIELEAVQGLARHGGEHADPGHGQQPGGRHPRHVGEQEVDHGDLPPHCSSPHWTLPTWTTEQKLSSLGKI